LVLRVPSSEEGPTLYPKEEGKKWERKGRALTPKMFKGEVQRPVKRLIGYALNNLLRDVCFWRVKKGSCCPRARGFSSLGESSRKKREIPVARKEESQTDLFQKSKEEAYT